MSYLFSELRHTELLAKGAGSIIYLVWECNNKYMTNQTGNEVAMSVSALFC